MGRSCSALVLSSVMVLGCGTQDLCVLARFSFFPCREMTGMIPGQQRDTGTVFREPTGQSNVTRKIWEADLRVWKQRFKEACMMRLVKLVPRKDRAPLIREKTNYLLYQKVVV